MKQIKETIREVLVHDGYLLIGPFINVQEKVAVQKILHGQPVIDLNAVGISTADESRSKSGVNVATPYLIFQFPEGVGKELINSVVVKKSSSSEFSFRCVVDDMHCKITARGGPAYALRQACRDAAMVANSRELIDPTTPTYFVLFGSKSIDGKVAMRDVPMFLYDKETEKLVELTEALESLATQCSK